MNDRQIALALLLKHLDIEPDPSSFDRRKYLQKIIYLGQQMGLNLNYKYGWYVYGPYSPELAKDYYQLAKLKGRDETERYKLSPDYQKILDKLEPFIRKPEVDLSKESWVELLASYNFLTERSRLNHEAALKKLEETKPHLVGYVESATEALDQVMSHDEGKADLVPA